MKWSILLVVVLCSLPAVYARTLEVGAIPNWKLGETYLGFEQNHNVTVDRFMNYFDIEDGNFTITRMHNFLHGSCRTHKCEIGLQFRGSPAHPSPLRNIIEGQYDASLYRIAGEVKAFEDAYNQTVVFRPLPEFFGWWNTYGIYNPNNTKADFIPAWKHIVDIMRSTGAQKIRFDWNAGGLQGWGRRNNGNEPYALYYPGDDYVDEMSMDMYNVPSISGVEWISFYDLFKGPYAEMVNITPDKPINVGETGSHSAGGNKSRWIADAFDAMIYNFTRMENIDFFFVDYGYGNPAGDVDLDTPEQEAAFREGVAKIRAFNLGAPECLSCSIGWGNCSCDGNVLVISLPEPRRDPLPMQNDGPEPMAYTAYAAKYEKSDLPVIVEDGIGTVLASVVEWADVLIFSVVLLFGIELLGRMRR